MLTVREGGKTLTLLLDEAGHLTNQDVDKAESFNAFFVPVFNSNNCPWVPEPGELKIITGQNINFQLTLNLFVTC